MDPDVFEPDGFNKVWAIKHMRFLGDSSVVGLKYAKDLIEELMARPWDNVVLEGEVVGEHAVKNAIEELNGIGIKVEPLNEVPLQLAKKAATIALDIGELVLARDLIAVLITHDK